MELDNLYQQLIIDHGTEPRNHSVMANANHEYEGFNPMCGDKIHMYVLVEDNTITDISFISKGCAISTASASIMSESLKGKTLSEANSLFEQFLRLMQIDEATPDTLGKLAALSGVKKYPSRIKCATLGWHTLQQALKV